MKERARVCLLVSVVVFSSQLYASGCPSCIDTGSSGCKLWGSGQASFQWASSEVPGPDITLTAGPCGLPGESGTGYIFSYINLHNAICNDDSPCGGDAVSQGYYAIIKISGNKKAFQHIFPDGISFKGDHVIRPYQDIPYYESIKVDQAGCEYALPMGGGASHHVSFKPTVSQCSAEFNDSKFNVSVKFYQERDPGTFTLLSSTTGSMTIKGNPKTDFDPLNFKPDLRDGTAIGWIEKIDRDYEYEDGQSEWKMSYKVEDSQDGCTYDDGWAACYMMDPIYQAVIPRTGTFYRVKYPAWRESVNGLPAYAAQEGWSYNATERYIKYDMDDEGAIYFHCDSIADNGGTSIKYLIQTVEYCTAEQSTGEGQNKWTCVYEYNSPAKLKYIHNGTNPNDPNSLTTATIHYDYDWGGDGNDPDVTHQARASTQESWQTDREWQLEFDSQDRPIKFRGGCSSGCGGAGQFEHVEYYSGSDDLITKRYNAAGLVIVENEYTEIEYGEYEPAEWIYIPNAGFESDDVSEETCDTLTPIGWENDDATVTVQVCDPNTGSQVLRPNDDTIETELWNYILPETYYLLEADIQAIPNAGESTATIYLYSTEIFVTDPLATITFTEGVDGDEDEWAVMLIGWDSTNYEDEEGDNGSFDNNPQFRIEITGNNVDIDNIQLSASRYIADKTKPVITMQKIRNAQGDLVTAFERTIDESNNTILEKRYLDSTDYRLTKLIYEDKAFTNIASRVEYGTLSDSDSNPTGNTYTTTYSADDPNALYYTYYPNGKRADFQKYEDGNLTESYILNLDNDVNSLRQLYEYDEFNVNGTYTDKLINATNANGGVTTYTYQNNGYRLLTEQKDPASGAGQQIITYTYDDARRVKTETRKLDANRNLVTSYTYNSTAGYVDSITANGATTYYTYNNFGQSIRETNPDGIITGKSYGTGGELLSEFVISEDTANPNGADSALTLISQTRYIYTDDGQIETVGQYKSDSSFTYQSDMDTNPDDWIITKYDYYANGKKKKIIEDYGTGRINLTTEYFYNYQDQVEKILYPTGKWVKTTRDGRGLVILEEVGYSTDAVVLETACDYDDNGNLIEQVNPDGTTLIQQYDNYGRLIKTYNGTLSGPYTEQFYDNAGNVIRNTARENDGAMLSDIRMTYDVLGNLKSERLCADPNTLDNANDFVTHYVYDIAGNPRYEIRAGLANLDPNENPDPNDLVTEFVYDNQGRRTRTIDPKGIMHSVYYTDGGLPVIMVGPNDPQDPNAFVTENVYDAYGRLEESIDPMGHYTRNIYNSLNQIAKQLVYDCKDLNTPDDDIPVRQIRTEFDNLGNTTRQAMMADPSSGSAITLGVDIVTDFVFDPNDGLLEEQKSYYGAGAVVAKTVFGYDTIGRRTVTTDAEGNKETIYYGSTSTTGSQIAKIEQFEKDQAESNNNYTITTFFEYDTDGRLSEKILDEDGDGTKETTDQTTTYTYDGLGRIETQTANDDVATFFAYDGFGNVKVKIEDYDDSTPDISHDRKTEFVYNRLNRQYQIKAYDPNDTTSHVAVQTTTWQYDKNGNVVTITYPDGKFVTYEYYLLNKPITEIKRDGTWIASWYDWNGNLIQVSDYDSDDPDCPNGSATFIEEYELDGAGNLIRAYKELDGSEVSESSFVYNGFGAGTSETAQYDDSISKTTAWTYDGSGNRLTQVHGDTTLTLTHDGLGRIKTIDKGNDEIVSYAYIGRNTKSIDYPEPDVTQDFYYDSLGRIEECKGLDPDSQTILDFEYTYDAVGNRDTCKYNHLAIPVWDVYEYDSLRRLEKVTYADDDGYVALNLENGRWMMDDLVLVALAWLDGDRLLTTEIAEKVVQDSTLLSQRTEQMEQILKEAGFRNVEAFLSSVKTIRPIAFNPDDKIYTLVELGDDIPNNYRSETGYNDAEDVIAQIIWDNKDRMVLFAMYPDSGEIVVVSITYDNGDNEISKLLTVFDADGNITHQDDLLLTSSMSAASMSMDSGTVMMSSSPEAPESASEEFVYDHLGNRYQYTDKVGYITTYTHNTVNQYSQSVLDLPLVPDLEQTFTCDDNGNLSEDGYGYGYTYDYRNRLIEAQYPSSSTIAEYVFDALGRRISRTVGSETTYFFYDTGGQVIAEYEDDTTPILTKEFVYGNGIDEVLAMFNHPELTTNPSDWDEFMEFIDAWLCQDPNDACYDAAYDDNNDDIVNLADFAAFADTWEIYPETETRYYYLKDALGSVRGLVGGRYKDPNDWEFYNYDVYGKLSVQDAEESKSGNPFLFAGYRYDAETGLYHTDYRAYDPETGRWMQLDPLGYADSMSLHEYCISNPTMYIDPLGTSMAAYSYYHHLGSQNKADAVAQKAAEVAGTMVMVPFAIKEQIDGLGGGICEFLDDPKGNIDAILDSASQLVEKGIERNVKIYVKVKESNKPIRTFVSEEIKWGKDFWGPVGTRVLEGYCNKIDRASGDNFWESCKARAEITLVVTELYYAGKGIAQLGKNIGKNVDNVADDIVVRRVADKSSKAIKTVGQKHHAISKKVYRELQESPTLAGKYKIRDPRFTMRAKNLSSHRGYQRWHRDLDDEMTKWLQKKRKATPEEFEKFLKSRYAKPDLMNRFPNGLE